MQNKEYELTIFGHIKAEGSNDLLWPCVVRRTSVVDLSPVIRPSFASVLSFVRLFTISTSSPEPLNGLAHGPLHALFYQPMGRSNAGQK